MKISIVIPTHERHTDLHRLLKTVSLQAYSEKYEVIVVSNLPDLKTQSIVDQMKGEIETLHYLVAGQKGVNVARNLGIARSRGDTVLFLDDDVRLNDQNYLGNLAEKHRESSEIDGIGGRYICPKDADLLERTYHLSCELWLLQSKTKGEDTLNLVGGNASYKRRVFDSGFKFDENIIFGGAETQFNARLIDHGFRLQLKDELSIQHDISIGISGFLRRAYRQGVARQRIALEGLSNNFRFFHHQQNRKQQIDSFVELRGQRPAVLYMFKIFDLVFRFGYKLEAIRVFEDSPRKICLKMLRRESARIWRSIQQIRVFWDIAQVVRIIWGQRAQFQVSGRDINSDRGGEAK